MYRLLPVKSWVFVIWLIFISLGLSARDLMPIDETRYASVAWEMWIRNDFLVPYLNGEPYSHKPPLLFWLMQLSWRLFGVNDWSIRVISPLFALGTVYLSAMIAGLLWPERKEAKLMAPLILLGSSMWAVYSSLTMFDMMLAFFVSMGIYSLLQLASAGLSLQRWLLLALAFGGGALTKGPVILLHLLPVALLAPWWRAPESKETSWRHWYGGLLCSTLLGVLIALCWAIPAGIAGGEAYRHAIFLGQTQGRLVDSFAHKSPWWWYLQFLPLTLLPWLLLKPLWLALPKLSWADSGLRFCAAWALPVFIVFSLISGKRLHYLLPLLPVLAIVLARAADQLYSDQRLWQRAHIGATAVLGLLGIVLAGAPWLKALAHWFPELAEFSPAWGILLFLIMAGLGACKAKNAEESVFYAGLASVLVLLIVSGAFFSARGDCYDTRQTAQKIAALMAENKQVAYLGGAYHGDYQFSGRLLKPLQLLSSLQALDQWAERNPEGYVVVRYKKQSGFPEDLAFSHQCYKGANVALVFNGIFLKYPQMKSVLLM